MDSMSFEELYYQVTMGSPMNSFLFSKGNISGKGIGINPGPLDPSVSILTNTNETILIPYHDLGSWTIVNNTKE